MRICPHCSSDVPSGSRCTLCGEQLPELPRAPWLKRIFSGGFKIGCGVALVLLVAVLAIPAIVVLMRSAGESNRRGSLKMLASAEADFRSNDRDGNGVQDFWTGDVAGLYCISPTPGASIRLIDLSVAASDSDPLRGAAPPYREPLSAYAASEPRSGYWLWAMRADASEQYPLLYRQDTEGWPSAGHFYNRVRFAFLAFPDSPASGRRAFIINEGNSVYGRPVDAFARPSRSTPPGRVIHPTLADWPPEAVLKRDWSRLD